MKNKQKQKTSVLYVFICCLFYYLLKSSCKKIKKISTNVKKKNRCPRITCSSQPLLCRHNHWLPELGRDLLPNDAFWIAPHGAGSERRGGKDVWGPNNNPWWQVGGWVGGCTSTYIYLLWCFVCVINLFFFLTGIEGDERDWEGWRWLEILKSQRPSIQCKDTTY
jgi:hypothetical protein